jgi:hypothetical protein
MAIAPVYPQVQDQLGNTISAICSTWAMLDLSVKTLPV